MDHIRVLIVDDDPANCDLLVRILSTTAYEAIVAFDGPEALRKLYDQKPDIVLLDMMMPIMDGFEVLKRIRELSELPVIVLTAIAETDVSTRALELGADDLITKPFDKDNLLARIRSVLRRAGVGRTNGTSAGYRDDHLLIDLAARRVMAAGAPIRLTVTEFDLLRYLCLHGSQVCTYAQILDNVWGGYAQNQFRYLHVYISRLRKKIEKEPERPAYLLTEYGVGYRFQKRPD